MAEQVRPNYGPQPRGKANIMRQGQTETTGGVWGQDPMVKGAIPMEPNDNPNLGKGA